MLKSKALNPAWRKCSSVVNASVRLFSVITTNEAQSVKTHCVVTSGRFSAAIFLSHSTAFRCHWSRKL
ncbi:MAG: hypothetical protein ACR2HG_06980 [Pyrinomonadaceae bacterium]